MRSKSLESYIDGLIARINAGGSGGAETPEALCDIAVEAVELMRLRRQLSEGEVEFGRTELALIARCGSLLRQCGKHHAARMMFDAAAKFAEGKDEYTYRFYLLQVSRCCVELVDVDSARAVLDNLGLPPLKLAESLEGAQVYTTSAASPTDLAYLRSAATLALATYWSAAGPLGLADEAWARAADFSGPLADPLCTAAEVELARAELRLDRGDLAGVDRLREASEQRSATLEQRAAWRVLHGMTLAARGRLSEADAELDTALTAMANKLPQGGAAKRVAEAAAWARLHVLAVLNRLDVADAMLKTLAALQGEQSRDLELMRELIAARRSSAREGLDLPPSVHETIKPSAADPRPAQPRIAPRPRDARRQHMRLRQDWARVADLIQLDLHHGQLAAAVAGLKVLTQWTADSDSAFLAARLDYVRSLVSYYAGDYAAAAELADGSATAFERRGMLLEQWSAARVRTWAKQRSNAGDAKLRATAEQEAALIDDICTHLKWPDRVTFLLNKWSSADERTAGWLRAYHEQYPEGAKGNGKGDRARRREAEELLHRVVRSWGHAHPANATRAQSPAHAATMAPDETKSFAADPFLLVSRRAAAASSRRGSEHDVPVSERLDRRTALLYFVVLPDRVELFVLSRSGGTQVLRVDVPRQTLRQRIAAANLFLHGNQTWEQSPALEQCADALMIDRATSLVGRVERLLVVPNDAIISAPLAALPVAEHREPLCARYAVALLPTFRWKAKGISPLMDRLSPWRKGAAFGVSDAAGAEPLAAVTEEMGVLRALLGRRVRVLESAEATRAAAGRELRVARFAHFACHGTFDPNDPLSSGLALSDGRLSIEEIGGMSLRQLQRVVAASCWSGDSTVLPGRELLGLSAAFHDAGVSEMITSLWQVFDVASPAFMGALYARLATQRAEIALAQTQAEAWRHGRPPREWAGYGISLRGETPGPTLARLRTWLCGR